MRDEADFIFRTTRTFSARCREETFVTDAAKILRIAFVTLVPAHAAFSLICTLNEPVFGGAFGRRLIQPVPLSSKLAIVIAVVVFGVRYIHSLVCSGVFRREAKFARLATVLLLSARLPV